MHHNPVVISRGFFKISFTVHDPVTFVFVSRTAQLVVSVRRRKVTSVRVEMERIPVKPTAACSLAATSLPGACRRPCPTSLAVRPSVPLSRASHFLSPILVLASCPRLYHL